VLAALVALLASGCTGDPASDAGATLAQNVPIGLLTATTGDDAAGGKSATQGAQLAIDVVNDAYTDLPLPLAAASGLQGGARLSLVVGDTAAAAEIEQRATELVRTRQAAGLVLADDLAVARAVGRQSDQLNVALVDALNSADVLADLSRSGHFRIAPSDRVLMETTFGLLHRLEAQRRRVERIVLVAGAGPGVTIEELQTSVTDVAGRFGFLISTTVPLTTPTPNVSDIQARVNSAQADVVLFAVANAAQAAAAADLATRVRGVRSVVAFGPGVGSLDQLRTPPLDLLRTAGWSTEYAKRHPVAAAVTALYERKFRMPMDGIAAATFTATLSLAAAINQAGSSDPASVREAMQQLSLAATQTIMPWNGLRFDANGLNQLAAGVVEQRVPSGFQVVYPNELAAMTLSWPA
jgi:branched-chain amino acid transport system substrate-binding protein